MADHIKAFIATMKSMQVPVKKSPTDGLSAWSSVHEVKLHHSTLIVFTTPPKEYQPKVPPADESQLWTKESTSPTMNTDTANGMNEQLKSSEDSMELDLSPMDIYTSKRHPILPLDITKVMCQPC